MSTMKDIANHTGFSVATVSAVVNKSPIVSESTKETIEKAILDLDYRPNNIARSLKNSKTKTVGVIIRNTRNQSYTELISSIESELWNKGYTVYFCSSEDNMDKELNYLENLISNKVGGVIIATARLEDNNNYSVLSENDIPYIFVNRSPKFLKENEHYIGGDNFDATSVLVKHIKEMGLKDVGYFSGPIHYSTYYDRYQGFYKSIENQNLNVKDEWVYFFDDLIEETVNTYIEKLINNQDLPEVILATTDHISFILYEALSKRGINVPEDIGIVSVDNTHFSKYLGLTSVDLGIEEIGKKAAIELLLKIENTNFNKNIEIYPANLIVRQSCKNKRN